MVIFLRVARSNEAGLVVVCVVLNAGESVAAVLEAFECAREFAAACASPRLDLIVAVVSRGKMKASLEVSNILIAGFSALVNDSGSAAGVAGGTRYNILGRAITVQIDAADLKGRW